MNDLKIKAWDKINHKWLNLYQLAFAKDGSLMAVNTIDGESYGLHQVNIIQYTGRKDKNGNEIYRGHIVKIQQTTQNNPKYFVVKFGRYYYYSSFGKETFHGYGYYIDCTTSEEKYGLLKFEKYIEIAGDIYNNPELIKV